MKIPYTPKSMELILTGKCNLRCSYCAYFSGSADVGVDLPVEEWLIFLRELQQNTVLSVTLAGGEVFLYKGLKEIIQGIVINRMRFAILTNATLVTEDMAEFIASTNRCDYIQVSVDGAQDAVHDATRGKGNFAKTLQGLGILKKHLLPVVPRVTINRYNVYHLEEIARFLLEEKEMVSFSTNGVLRQGLCRQSVNELMLTVAERSFAMKELLRLSKKYPGRIKASAGPLFDARKWPKLKLKQAQKEIYNGMGGHLGDCRENSKSITVRSDGVMTPCAYLGHIELGRINKDSLKEVWQHHPELNRLRSRRKIDLGEFEFCNECQYKPYCGGSCPAIAYSSSGDDYKPSEENCLKRFLEAGGVLPDVEPGEDLGCQKAGQSC